MKKDWYYVRHLMPGEIHDNSLPFEIQVLNDHGQATVCWYFDSGCQKLSAKTPEIPPAVIEAAKVYPVGFGDYVDPNGNTLDMFGNQITRQPLDDIETLALSLLESAIRLKTMPSPDRHGAEIRLRAIVEYYPKTAAASKAASILSQTD